jgi:hypothetical protein
VETTRPDQKNAQYQTVIKKVRYARVGRVGDAVNSFHELYTPLTLFVSHHYQFCHRATMSSTACKNWRRSSTYSLTETCHESDPIHATQKSSGMWSSEKTLALPEKPQTQLLWTRR